MLIILLGVFALCVVSACVIAAIDWRWSAAGRKAEKILDHGSEG